MNASSESPADQLNSIRQIDVICDEFEEELRNGRRPELRQILAASASQLRPQLLGDLLAILRHHLSEEELASYRNVLLELCPEHTETIITALRDDTLGVAAEWPEANEQSNSSCGLQTGERFGKFEIIEEIARGGMGIVFKAFQSDLERTVALKLIASGQLAGGEEIERFKREARAVAALNHPNIVSIYEVDQVDKMHYFSMNYFQGVTLDVAGTTYANDIAEVCRIMSQVCSAVDYAHQHGIVHRDLKPSNVLVDNQGKVQVIDFGLAKEFNGLRSAITGEQLIGTPLYMAPEQLLREPARTGPESDIYAIGVILYELLTQRKPFSANSLFELMQQIDTGQPDPPSSINSSLSPEFDRICGKCMAKNAEQRFATAGQVADALQDLAENCGKSDVVVVLEKPSTELRSSGKLKAMMVTLAVLGVLLLFLALSVLRSSLSDEEISLALNRHLGSDLLLTDDPDSDPDSPENLARLVLSFDPSESVVCEDIQPVQGRLILGIKLVLAASSFDFDRTDELENLPTPEEARQNPSLITPQLNSVIRGHYAVSCRIEVRDGKSQIVKSIEKMVKWDDMSGHYLSESWNVLSKAVEVEVIQQLAEMDLGSNDKVTLTVTLRKAGDHLIDIHRSSLLIY